MNAPRCVRLIPQPDSVEFHHRPLYGAAGAKVAVTFFALLMVTTQDPLPVQSPDHPENVELASATAVNVTLVPVAKFAVHALVHATLVGFMVTVPPPRPACAMVSNSVPPAESALTRIVSPAILVSTTVTLKWTLKIRQQFKMYVVT